MIDGLRRRFARPVDNDPWDADQEFQPEVDEVSQLPTDTAVLLAATKMATESTSNDIDMREYYKSVVQTAIQHGGKYQGQEMSVPWLRMILSGLEMKPMAPETLWDGDQEARPGSITETPLYEELFPSERSPP